jgi:putative multiple sugar transport system permease protein
MHITTLVVGVILTLIYIYLELSGRSEQKKYNFAVIPLQFTIAKIVLVALAINWFMYLLASYKGIPNVLILLVVLIVFYTFITTKTVLGRHIYAVGGNEKAAKLSGVKTQRTVFWVFVNMGVLAALSGLVFAARLNAATPKAGMNFELDAIAACFIGGASTAGGIGAVMGAIIGGLVMGVMNNGMSLMGVTVDMQQTIKGLVLLFAVAFDIYTKSKQS